MDAARYVPSSSSKNKRATAPPAPPLRRTTAAAAATAFMVGAGGCGRRRASAATVVGCGTSTAASARPWRVLGRIVRSVSAARRAQGTQRIREEYTERLYISSKAATESASYVLHLLFQAFLPRALECYWTL